MLNRLPGGNKGDRTALTSKLPSPRWILQGLLSFLLLGVLCHLVDWNLFFDTLKSIKAKWLLVPIVLYVPGKILDSCRWFFLLKKLGENFSFWSVFRHNMWGQFAALILPGQISADIVKGLSASHRREQKLAIAVSLIADKSSLLFAVSFFASLGVLSSGPLAHFRVVYSIALGLLISSLIFLITLCRYRAICVPRTLRRLSEKVTWLERLRLSQWKRLPRLSVGEIALVLILSVALQVSYSFASYCTARSLSINLAFLDWTTMTALVALAQVLPISLGGLGVREGLFVTFLSLYSIPIERATAFSLVGYGLIIVLTMVTLLIVSDAFYQRGK